MGGDGALQSQLLSPSRRKEGFSTLIPTAQTDTVSVSRTQLSQRKLRYRGSPGARMGAVLRTARPTRPFLHESGSLWFSRLAHGFALTCLFGNTKLC